MIFLILQELITMEEMNNEIQFYKESLRLAEIRIETENKTGKALKDAIGGAFEEHRERIWNHFGFKVSKDKKIASFVDWCITYEGKLIALEEDKGHYLDSCFLERALSGFCKTINTYKEINKDVPLLILHSFTKYNLYNQKLKEDMDTRKLEISDELQKKIVYTTLTECDRLSQKKWFSKEYYKGYSDNANDELIIKDIKFIRSLIPVSQ